METPLPRSRFFGQVQVVGIHFLLTNQEAGYSNTLVSDAGSLSSQVVVYSDLVKCPGVPLVWPYVLPQWRPCVKGHGGSKNMERRLAAPIVHGTFGDILVNCPNVSLVWSCVLPQWRPCTTELVEFEKDRKGSKRCLPKLSIIISVY
jgi:hypothetical protein